MAANMSPVEHMQTPSDEKLKASHVDEANSQKSALSDDTEFSPAEQRKIIHRIDRRLVLTCGVMYCVSLMDRTNLGQAVIAGMSRELHLNVGFRYVSLHIDSQVSMLTVVQSIIVLVFFITYVIFQPPATVLCRKIGPRPFLAFITTAWGVVMASDQWKGLFLNPALTWFRLEWDSRNFGLS
jgi:hypothetical protein